MASVIRNLPLWIVTISVSLLLYMLWKQITRLERVQRDTTRALDQLTNEFYYTLSGSDNNKSRVVETGAVDNVGIPPYIVAQNIDQFQRDNASSVASEDVLDEGIPENGLDESNVDVFIGNLQDKFVSNLEDDVESVMSGGTLSGGRKKSPPQSAASFPVGHQQMHNGKLYEVIKTKTNVIRWGKPTGARQNDVVPAE